MRFTRQRSKPSVDLDIINEDVKKDEKPIDKEFIDNFVKKKHFKERVYLEVLDRFLQEKTEYCYMKMYKLDDVKKAFYAFIHNPENNVDLNLNVPYLLSCKDIASLNKNIEFKRIHLCPFCDKKHRKNCCENFDKNKRKTNYHVIHIKIKE